MRGGQAGRRPDWALVVSASAAGLGILWLLLALPPVQGSIDWTMDLMAYRDAASRFLEDGSLYSDRSLEGPFLPYGSDLYLYPPPLGLTMTLFSDLTLAQSGFLWYLLHVGAVVGACLLMPVGLTTRLAALGIAAFSFAVLRDLVVGNVSAMLLLPMAAGWRFLDRPAGSVALALAIGVRTSFGVYLVWQALRRAWQPLLWTLLMGAMLIVASLLLVGVGGYRDYLTMLGHIRIDADLNSSDLARTALALGAPEDSAWMAVIIGWFIAGLALLASLRRDIEVGYMVTLGASLLLAPLMWEHYLALVVLPAAFLASRGHPWALALPMLTWLPRELLAFVAIAATLLPFLARDASSLDRTRPATASSLAAGQAPVQG